MVRSRIKVIEHQRTVNGVLRLSDGSSPTPLRLVGRPEQRAALLRALKLPADARPLAPVVPDLSTSPKTKAAYAASPTPPPATGPLADVVLASLGSAKAQLLVTATQMSVHPQWPGGDVIVVATGKRISFVPVGSPRPTMGLTRGSLRWALHGSELEVFYDHPVRSTLALLRGDQRSLNAVVDLISGWARLEAEAEARTEPPDKKPAGLRAPTAHSPSLLYAAPAYSDASGQRRSAPGSRLRLPPVPGAPHGLH